MDYYTDLNGIIYDKVKYHTRKKHKFIESYLKIWSERVKNGPTLDIFDLYASTGKCYCEKAEKYGLSESKWDGSAILSAKCLMEYSNGKNLFLNTYADTNENCKKQIENLNRLLFELGFSKPQMIISQPIESAVDIAINHIRDPKYPTLWILDPYAASDLPWNVVEKIARIKTEYPYKGEDRIRKPELIITLMTEDFQRWYKTNPELISIALGLNEDVWKPKIESLIKSGQNTREAFLSLYMERLSEFYEKSPISFEVNITQETAVVYCMLLLTDSDAGYHVSRLKAIPDFQKWVVSEWRDGAKKIILENDLSKKGQTKLFIDY